MPSDNPPVHNPWPSEIRLNPACDVLTVAFDDGRIIELRAGSLFYVPPVPHDSWVVGNEPYVSLHFLGAERYAK